MAMPLQATGVPVLSDPGWAELPQLPPEAAATAEAQHSEESKSGQRIHHGAPAWLRPTSDLGGRAHSAPSDKADCANRLLYRLPANGPAEKKQLRTEIQKRYEVLFPVKLNFNADYPRPNTPEFKKKVARLMASHQLVEGTDYVFDETEYDSGRHPFGYTEVLAVGKDRCHAITGADGPVSDIEDAQLFKDSFHCLKNEAKLYLADCVIPARPVILSLAADASDEAVIRTLLSQHSGLVIGEDHSAFNSKRFFIDNAATFKQNGVETLFLEHLIADRHQADLDQYFAREPGSQMPGRLKLYLLELNHMQSCKNKTYNFYTLVKAAQQAQITVTPIDCNASYEVHQTGLGGVKRSTLDRMEVMNYLATEKIRAREHSGKWLSFVGSSHLYRFSYDTYSVPGLAELTGAPGIIPVDVLAHKETRRVRTTVADFLPGVGPVDVVLGPLPKI